jgi:hypothetical protein
MVCALSLSTLAAVPLAATAQASNGVRVPELSALQIGVTAKISAAGQKTQGTVTDISRDTVWLSNGGDRLALPFTSVDSVWVHKRQTAQGFAIGAGLGAIALGSFGALVVSGLCETDSCVDDMPAAILVGGLIGGGIGGLLGAGIGSVVQRWKRVSP